MNATADPRGEGIEGVRARALRALAPYALAVALVGVGVAARAALDPFLGAQLPYVSFFIAVAAIAFLSGPGPTMLGIELGYLAASWFFVAPRHSFARSTEADPVSAVAYFVVCAAIFGLSELRARALRRAEASAAVARERQRELEREVAEHRGTEDALRASEEALRASEERLRRENLAKDDFIAVLSHELRNPLAPLRGGVAVLRRAPEGEIAVRTLAAMDRQLAHLARLVEDLLDVNRISHGKVRLQRAALDLREVVGGVVEDHRAALDAGGLALAVALPAAPVWIEADEARLAQALGNLLGNAVKFTPPGGRVRVSLATDPIAERATVSVRDTGVGIEPGVRHRIFEPFAQCEMSLDRCRGGLGLGLTLAKRIVELHGGAISAASDGPGTGAEFRTTLPMSAAPACRSELGPPDPAVGAVRRRIVIVEDNEDAATTLAEFLDLEGHDVQVAANGVDGLALVRRLSPHLVFCDIGLPGLSGYDVARALREDGADVTLVALTGYASPEDARQAAAAGFDLHVPKPADLDELGRIATLGRAGAPRRALDAGGRVARETDAPGRSASGT